MKAHVYTSPPSSINFHPTIYFEIEIPQELDEKITAYVVKEIETFEAKCNCESCKTDRNDRQTEGKE